MSDTNLSVLLVGGTGSIGRHVARRALAAGHRVRVLTRRPDSAPAGTDAVGGDLTDPGTLNAAVDGIDAVIFTHGAPFASTSVHDVDYGGVRNILEAVGDREVRIVLMTAIGVTNRAGGYHDWKRRSERLVRASGHASTIVRPGWFDMNEDDQHSLHFLQGDRRWAGSPADGVIARSQIADVLVAALTSDAAAGKTCELVAEHGPAQQDLDPMFDALEADGPLDPPQDTANMPLADEPAEVRADLERAGAQ
ncbi:SDR family oxidoreductase [Corynebacterium terpenotabidum]|uniref:NmrA-like protein n=1 Tax=Corynebacterium terpenotabidum Y-11 TaxID=1200352 RepID=S4XI30_9CORY|nr:SDR family oxidoreductase [Corynebacterium terpenotabidum]AGP30278.1 NmrA-like protein [Corynebacterium terpenotabidum Y-11]